MKKKQRDLNRDKTWWDKKFKKRTLGSEMQTINVIPSHKRLDY